MKLRQSLIAAAALALVGSANALTPAQIDAERAAGTLKEISITGASALRLAVGGFLQADVADPATFNVYFHGPSSGADHRAYAFRSKAAITVGTTTIPAGTAFLVTKRDAGGSGQGVGPIITADATQQQLVVNGGCTATGNPSPSVDIQSAAYVCPTTAGRLADAGISDVEPELLEALINNGAGRSTANLDVAGVVQNIFAVAVNKKAYLALQKAQGLVPLSATVIDESPTAQPSVPSSFVRGALTGQIAGSLSSKKGWNLLIPASVDPAVDTKRVNVCRRTPGSGTQAASNAYFTNNPCGSSTNTAFLPTVGSTTAAVGVTGTAATRQGSSTQLVEGCLLEVENLAGEGYAMGVLGRENNPTPTVGGVVSDKGYRYVKLSGAAPTRAAAIAGDYEFVVESTMQWAKTGANAPTGDKLAFLQFVRTNFGKASVLRTLDADLQQGLIAAPSTYTGAWIDLPIADRDFSAHTNRISGKSCSPVRMTK